MHKTFDMGLIHVSWIDRKHGRPYGMAKLSASSMSGEWIWDGEELGKLFPTYHTAPGLIAATLRAVHEGRLSESTIAAIGLREPFVKNAIAEWARIDRFRETEGGRDDHTVQ